MAHISQSITGTRNSFKKRNLLKYKSQAAMFGIFLFGRYHKDRAFGSRSLRRAPTNASILNAEDTTYINPPNPLQNTTKG